MPSITGKNAKLVNCSVFPQITSLPRLTFWVSTEQPTNGWRRRGVVVGGVRRMNEVNARRVRLVLRWVTVFRRVYHLGM